MVPKVLHAPDELRQSCDLARSQGARVGFVPTMGALHEGHLALVRDAKRRAAFVVVSIFVNPTQFGPGEDFGRYPRDLDGDVRKLAKVGADAVFAPSSNAMYPDGDQTRVHVGALAEALCGPFRPGHFSGVATVVSKLFALVGPSVAVFGQKDYQQLAIIRRVTEDLFFPVEVVGHPILRDPDGLAMSSRNAYLSVEERTRALSLSGGLKAAATLWKAGERDATALRESVRAAVLPAATSVDYVEISDPDTLVPLRDGDRATDRALAAIACRIGATRLIDNCVLGATAS